MNDAKETKRQEMARAEYKSSVDFYAGVKKAEQQNAGKKKGGPEQGLHEIVNVLEGRWMH